MSSCNRTLTRPEIVPNTSTSVCCGDKHAKLTQFTRRILECVVNLDAWKFQHHNSLLQFLPSKYGNVKQQSPSDLRTTSRSHNCPRSHLFFRVFFVTRSTGKVFGKYKPLNGEKENPEALINRYGRFCFCKGGLGNIFYAVWIQYIGNLASSLNNEDWTHCRNVQQVSRCV